jgi:enamine deaminase RidA (YjgF/YER057c/UK114 family)
MEVTRHGDFSDDPTLPVISRAVVHSGLVYTSGIVGEPGGNVATQTAQVLARLDALLAEVGADRSGILSAQVWLSDMKDFQAHNEVWDAWVDRANPPARACVGAQLYRSDILVEIRVIAMVTEQPHLAGSAANGLED